MERDTIRRAGTLMLVVVISAAGLLVNAGSAVAAGRKAAGTYTATFADSGATSKLTITNATGSTVSGTFAFSDIGDYGTWVAQGVTVAFSVSVSNSGHDNAVLIGKLTSTGITGVIGQPGAGVHSWSATRTGGASTATSVAVSPAIRRAAAKATVYSATFKGAQHDTLAVSKDTLSKAEGTFTLTAMADSGTWVKYGKKIAFSVTASTTGDDGIVFMGTLTTVGISSATAPGVLYQQGAGVSSWYATKG